MPPSTALAGQMPPRRNMFVHACLLFLPDPFAVFTVSYTILIYKCYVSGDYAMDNDGLLKCNCMPACSEITYDVENSHAKFSWLETTKALVKAVGSNHTITAT
jgi:hypothetical protein